MGYAPSTDPGLRHRRRGGKSRRQDHNPQSRRCSLRLPNFRRWMGGVRHGQGVGSSRETEKRQVRGASVWVQPKAKDLAEIAHLIDTRKIKPVVTQVLPLSEAIAAEQQAATHHTRGKVVLRVADEPKS